MNAPTSATHSATPSTLLHRVWKLGADIDTDLLAPGHAMKHGVEIIAQHCLEGIRPEFAQAVRAGDVIVAGPNFGIGSSREQAAAVLVHLGVKAVLAPSFSGLFFRNAFNLGLLLLTCPDQAGIEEITDGESVMLDLQTPALIRTQSATQSATQNRTEGVQQRLLCEPIPDFLMQMVQSGGLLNQLRARFSKESPE